MPRIVLEDTDAGLVCIDTETLDARVEDVLAPGEFEPQFANMPFHAYLKADVANKLGYPEHRKQKIREAGFDV